jgi:NAD(P)H-flavin reductase
MKEGNNNMRTKLNLQPINEKLYLPEPARIIAIETLAEKEKFFRFELLERKTLGNRPGQFLQVSALGIGEAPISITSAPSTDNTFEMSIRAVGDVTSKFHTLKVGDIVHIRGPFGNGFSDGALQKMQNKHLLFIVGGIGIFPARSLINKVLAEKMQYKKITILYGCKTPKDRMYADELDKIYKIGGNVELLETVDCADERWTCGIGVITTLIPKITFDPHDTIALLFGPPIMFKFVLKSLSEKHMAKANIYVDLERRMKCGVGKCGHCQVCDIYMCQEGPVFNLAEVESNEELL